MKRMGVLHWAACNQITQVDVLLLKRHACSKLDYIAIYYATNDAYRIIEFNE